MKGLFLHAQDAPSKRLQTYAQGNDFMSGRLELLRVIAEHGPARRCDIAQHISGDFTHPLHWLLDQQLITRAHGQQRHTYFSATSYGRRRLQSGAGETVPPATMAPQPWAMVRDLAWPTMRAGADRAFDVPSAGIPT